MYLRGSLTFERYYPQTYAVFVGGVSVFLGLDVSQAPSELLGAVVSLGAITSGFAGMALSVLTISGTKFMQDLRTRGPKYIQILRDYMGWALFGGISLSLTSIVGLWIRMPQDGPIALQVWFTAFWVASLVFCLACLWRLAKIVLFIFSDPDNIPGD